MDKVKEGKLGARRWGWVGQWVWQGENEDTVLEQQ